uniref:TIR domain-containing protein n=1 Tax=Zooxanthella nutricula TaxID=1333877 RepID=A0A7S2QAE7_9DINO
MGDVRVWFCTTCNNQKRVIEELGDDVSRSPFAQVLQSVRCSTVAVVSPLEALNRKWCNYEFCLGTKMGKRPLLVTDQGIVQAGMVVPQQLFQLAEKLRNFHCKQATCFNAADAALIDNAVEDMGGYDQLDSAVKQMFYAAIKDAHAWTQQALRIISGEHSRDSFSSDTGVIDSAPSGSLRSLQPPCDQPRPPQVHWDPSRDGSSAQEGRDQLAAEARDDPPSFPGIVFQPGK